MISQADIIKTLINKNCTDEAVMNTALSTNYSPPKLLEKLTEAERFDVALDVSMKLRLDVIPLWRTWAMRCLQNRNFQGARDKFRHCFSRLRKPGGAPTQAHKKLLHEITKVLSKMDNLHMPLSEEIKLIIVRNSLSESFVRDDFDNQEKLDEYEKIEISLVLKPKIYEECQYYLKEYGSIEDNLIFLIENHLWDEAVKILIQNQYTTNDQCSSSSSSSLSPNRRINLDKFFINEIFLRSASKESLIYLIEAFLKLDPKIIQSVKYFKAIYDFCYRNKKYNLLYYVQNSIGDYVAAARTQVNYFFLRQPTQSYSELDKRLPSLMNALQSYNKYLTTINNLNGQSLVSNNNLDINSKDKQENNVSSEEQTTTTSCHSLFRSMSKHQVEEQIKLLTLQIDITRNFAVNEVTGCINGIDLTFMDEKQHQQSSNPLDNGPQDIDELSTKTKQITLMNNNNQQQQQKPSNDNEIISIEDNNPVTLFDENQKRKTFLAALILVYYDLTCSTYLSKSGLDLANKIIIDHDLDKVNVFKTAMRVIIDDESYDILESASILLTRIEEDYLACRAALSSSISSAAEATVATLSPKSNKSLPTYPSKKVNRGGNAVFVVRQQTAAPNITDKSTNTSSVKIGGDKSRSASVVGPTPLTPPPRTQSSKDANQRQRKSSDTSTSRDYDDFDNADQGQQQQQQHPSFPSALRHKSFQDHLSPVDGARAICDEVIRDSIKVCTEADYKMELAKLLSAEAKIELYIELGKLSNAQSLAFAMNRADYVENIIEEASKLNQNHVKTVCQLWLAKHETRNLIR